MSELPPAPRTEGHPTGDTKWRRRGAILGLIAAVLYLLNPTAGFFEILPDYLPIVGNIDEGFAGAVVLWAVRIIWETRKRP